MEKKGTGIFYQYKSIRPGHQSTRSFELAISSIAHTSAWC